MTAFDELLQQARAAALESVGELAGMDLGNAEMAVDDAAYHAVDGIMPDPDSLDPQWVIGMLGERPGLLKMDADPGDMASAFVGAVRDLILDAIDDDVQEHARSVGIDLPDAPAP